MASDLTPEQELAELEIEENRIMRELAEMDEAATNKALTRQRRTPTSTTTSDTAPLTALNQLLAECEAEVREAKGYIASSNPSLRIARCRRGEGVPTHATYLSRPKATGVDFTVPVALKEYNAVIKNPIFLNSIRDKCAANKYHSPDEYIADMKLLWKNTATFNKGAGLEWVVQHAKLLHECAEEAVARRRRAINEAMSALGMPRSNDRKRKRGTSEANGGSQSNINVGMTIQIYWEDDRRWHTGKVREKSGSQVQIEYENDANGTEWLDLQREAKWRLPTSRGSKRIESANKRKKSSANTGGSGNGAVVGVGKEELVALKDELVALIEDSKMAVLNTVQERHAAIENKLNRSDALHRVLIAVNDVQDTFHGKFGIMQKNVEQLQEAVSQLATSVSKGAFVGIQREDIDVVGQDEGNVDREAVENRKSSPANKDCDTGKDSVSEEVETKERDEMDTDPVGNQGTESVKIGSKDNASENENDSVRNESANEPETGTGENVRANGCAIDAKENGHSRKSEGPQEKEAGDSADEQITSNEEDMNKKLKTSLSDEPEVEQLSGMDTGTGAVEVASMREKEGNENQASEMNTIGDGEKEGGCGGDDGGDSDSDGSSSGSGESDSESDGGQDEEGKVKSGSKELNIDNRDSSDDMRDSS